MANFTEKTNVDVEEKLKRERNAILFRDFPSGLPFYAYNGETISRRPELYEEITMAAEELGK